MGHRLSTIVTRSGDTGVTRLGDGTLTVKESPRIEAIGTLDELNSLIGLVIAYGLPDEMAAMLRTVQHSLFNVGGELSLPGRELLQDEEVRVLERELNRINSGLPPLEEFLLPGGTPASAACHVARAVCRRAERRVWCLSREEPINPVSLRYLNRLSDLLFVAARVLAQSSGGEELLWRNPGSQG